MDKKRVAEIQSAINFFKSMGVGKQVLDMIRTDMEKGLKKEEVAIYAESRMNMEHMKMCSRCLREGVDKQAIEIIVDERLNNEEMSMFYDAYKKGLSKDTLTRILNEEDSGSYRNAIDSALNRGEEQAMIVASEVSGNVISNGRMYYLVPVEDMPDVKPIAVEREKASRNTFISLVKKIFMSRRSNRDIVSKVINKELNKEQLEQIKIGISKGLTESQLITLINSNAEAERMEKIIEIAVLENAL